MTPREPIDIAVPGDKSLSHRALIFAALAQGESHISGILDSADVRSTAECLRRLGVAVPPLAARMTIGGNTARAFTNPRRDLDCGNSGTTTRLLAGVVAGAGRTARFIGDASLSKRPMKRVSDLLTQMGASVSFEAGDGLPMRIVGAPLRGIEYESTKSSAQIKSAVLLAGLTAGVRVRYAEPIASRDHTERMLGALGAPVRTSANATTLEASDGTLRAFTFDVPGDPSSAAFFAAWGALRGVPIRTNTISVNATRVGFFDALHRMGAEVETTAGEMRCGEPVGRFVVTGTVKRAIALESRYVPGMIDELPLLACVGAYASGETRVHGAAELRVKESDRITTVVNNLNAIGVHAEELPDGFVVRGERRALRGRVVTHGDHRIAMAFGILGALPGNAIEIDEPGCVDVSFPTFWSELKRVGSDARAA
ncbi:MAG TPA: 3-phosphoshikimate 1-carboxyvinyltransferase [Gemmatimonadaceae bacterium]|nr:3-phosphoshikimate 1-carboxyvinyltransferase [Gemmatimonadaceae bacterium]